LISDIAPALLEDWLRDRYFECRTDISSSGAGDHSLGALRELLGITVDELDAIDFRDSPSLGSARLRAALAKRYAPALADSVMVTHGSSEALFLALATLLRPGDQVVTMSPAYQSLASIASALGATVRPWLLAADRGFRPCLDELEQLVTPRTRAVVVNFPHNPTGTTLNADEYARLLAIVERSGCHLLWDGAFADFTYDAEPLPTPAAETERCLSFGTLSKSYGLPGLRIGWCFGPGDVLRDMMRLRDYTTLSCSPLTEYLAAVTVEQADTVIGPLLARARTNRALLGEWARDKADIVEYVPPGGGVCTFPRLVGAIDATALCAGLAGEDGVLAVPGSCFAHPDHVRIGFGGPTPELRAGLKALAERARRTSDPGVLPTPPFPFKEL
jgi:capreomycidine synthase